MKPIHFTLVACAFIAIGCASSGETSSSNGSKTTITDPTTSTKTTTDTSSVTEADLGAPFYPGSIADPADGGDGSAKIVMNSHITISSTRLTADPIAKIMAFYKEKEPTWENAFSGGETGSLHGKASNGGEIEGVVTKQDDKWKISMVNTMSKP